MTTRRTAAAMSRDARRDADREVVRELVHRVGRFRLRFDVYDVRAELDAAPWLTLHQPAHLALRLRELEGTCLTRVDGTFALILAHATPRDTADTSATSRPTAGKARGGQPGARVTHQYALTERTHELAHVQPAALDDLERVTLAVAVATLTLGGAPAPTRLITAVLASVPALMLAHPGQQTNVLLGRLARREVPVLAESKAGAARSARWQLVEPLKAGWLDWIIAQTRAHEGAIQQSGETAAAGGAASQAQVAARIVDGAVRTTRSSHWPHGHPVSAREIQRVIATARQSGVDPHGLVPLADALDRQGVGLTAVLQSAVRAQFADGSTRRTILVRRIEHPRFQGVRYLPGDYDARDAQAWIDWTVLRTETKAHVLGVLQEEWREAAALAGRAEAPLRAVGLVRQVALRAAVDERVGRANGLLAPLSLISGALSNELDVVRAALDGVAGAWPATARLSREARRALEPWGFSLPEVVNAARPVVTAAELAAWMPTSITLDLSPAVLKATAVTVRRAARPGDGKRSRVGEGRVEARPLDRVDAVRYAAESAALPGVIAIQQGATLLGALLAHVGLVRRVLGAARAEDRIAALGALVLLGDVAYVATVLRRQARTLTAVVAPMEAASLVELARWVDADTRAAVVAAGLRDHRQTVQAAARRVVD